jgi:hypothetical protein
VRLVSVVLPGGDFLAQGPGNGVGAGVQCLGDLAIGPCAAWENSRNKHHTKADWQFTSADARVKLKRLYPAM